MESLGSFLFLIFLLKECLNLFPAIIALSLKETILIYALFPFIIIWTNPSKHGLVNRSRGPGIPSTNSKIGPPSKPQAQNHQWLRRWGAAGYRRPDGERPRWADVVAGSLKATNFDGGRRRGRGQWRRQWRTRGKTKGARVLERPAGVFKEEGEGEMSSRYRPPKACHRWLRDR